VFKSRAFDATDARPPPQGILRIDISSEACG
jgi:hypothetical protein